MCYHMWAAKEFSLFRGFFFSFTPGFGNISPEKEKDKERENAMKS